MTLRQTTTYTEEYYEGHRLSYCSQVCGEDVCNTCDASRGDTYIGRVFYTKISSNTEHWTLYLEASKEYRQFVGKNNQEMFMFMVGLLKEAIKERS